MLQKEKGLSNGTLIQNYRIPYALRRVCFNQAARLIEPIHPPVAGSIALAKATEIGKTTKIETLSGRLSALYEGDLMAVVFGHRYATAQFEAYAEMKETHCDLLTMAGVCGIVHSKHDATPRPTQLEVMGYFAEESGFPLQLRAYSMKQAAAQRTDRPRIVIVCGGSMDSGKTYTSGAIIRGLVSAGHRVGAGKLTGTAAGRDGWLMLDAGASPVYDFVDCGFPSTFGCTLDELHTIFDTIVSNLASERVDYIVLEIADGLLQSETASLLQSREFTDQVDAFVYAAADPLSAVGGLSCFRSMGIEPIAFSGLISRSRLGIEEVEKATGLPCLSAKQLMAGFLNAKIESLQA